MVAQPIRPTTLPLTTAHTLVKSFAEIIRGECEKLVVAGSIRRGQPYVKDAELVAIPKPGLLPLLDRLVELGTISKALYGAGSHRWGPKYRGLNYGELRVEISLADGDNWGNMLWLRSGPRDGNEFVMGYISHTNPAIRFKEGFVWHSAAGWKWLPKGKEHEWQADDRVKLRVPDEETLFKLLGMPYIPPGERGEQRYKKFMQWNRYHQWPDFTAFIAPEPVAQPVIVPVVPRQISLFGDALLDAEVKHIDKAASGQDAPKNVIPWLHSTALDEGKWRAQVYAGAVQRTERALALARAEAAIYSSYARRVAQLERELAALRLLI